jgi:uncharacterized protein (TIGR03067 family)
MLALWVDDAMLEELVRKDQDKLQGRWTYVSGSRTAELLIAGNLFAVHFRTGVTYRGKFTLDPLRRPKGMDLRILEGPERHVGQVARAIYALDGKHLIWCPGRPGAEERPPFFPPPGDQEHLCIVFRKVLEAAA